MLQRKKGFVITLMASNKLSIRKSSKVLSRKVHFRIERNKCILLCFTSYSNIYLCLLDCDHKSIITKTAGSAKVSSNNSKKEKKALHNVYKIVLSLKPYVDLYFIKYLDIEFRGAIALPLLNVLMDNLEKIDVKTVSFRLILTTPHNGMRVRTQRRV